MLGSFGDTQHQQRRSVHSKLGIPGIGLAYFWCCIKPVCSCVSTCSTARWPSPPLRLFGAAAATTTSCFCILSPSSSRHHSELAWTLDHSPALRSPPSSSTLRCCSPAATLHSSSYSTPSPSSATAAATLVPPPSPLKLAFYPAQPPLPPTRAQERARTTAALSQTISPSGYSHSRACCHCVLLLFTSIVKLLVPRLKKKPLPRFLNSAATAD